MAVGDGRTPSDPRALPRRTHWQRLSRGVGGRKNKIISYYALGPRSFVASSPPLSQPSIFPQGFFGFMARHMTA